LKEGKFRLDVRKSRSMSGGVQGQAGWGPRQPGLVSNVEVGVPACGGGVGAS